MPCSQYFMTLNCNQITVSTCNERIESMLTIYKSHLFYHIITYFSKITKYMSCYWNLSTVPTFKSWVLSLNKTFFVNAALNNCTCCDYISITTMHLVSFHLTLNKINNNLDFCPIRFTTQDVIYLSIIKILCKC